jgi:predicted nucleic-acid-binding Zn-ribbon protein
MIQTKQCPKCGNNRIAGPHRVYGQHHVRIDLPGLSTATLEAFTCADCGYTEFYSDAMGLRNIRNVGRFVLSRPSQPTARCKRCGAYIKPGDSFCQECGTPFG